MTTQNRIFTVLFALLTVFPVAFFAPLVQAQSAVSPASPRIDGFDVEQVRRLAPGIELDFTLYGTPGGIATVKINGTKGAFLLEEVELGLYEGTYTVKSKDRIPVNGSVTANLRLGNHVTSAILDESLVAATARTPAQRKADAASGAIPKIDRFDVEPVGELVAGTDLNFTLYGNPGGKASIRIAGAKGAFFLQEEKNGVYEGTYTIKNRDRIAANSVVTGNLRLGDKDATAILGKSLVATSAQLPVRRPAAICAYCGVVEAVNVIEIKGDGSYVGLIAGGLAGGLLGSQVGQGKGTTAAEIAGAIGGAYAGREIEKNVKKTKHYEVVVRLQGGGTQAMTYATEPGFRVGDKVKVVNGTLVRE